MTYDFDDQNDKGKRHEARLDRHFSEWFEITPASDREQRAGIDRHYRAYHSGRHYTVEYKADETASKTGNAFVETVSVDSQNKPGWAYTSQSTYLFYFLPKDDLVYMLTFVKLRNQLRRWIAEYDLKTIPNKGYNTIGVLVPLVEFERHAIRIVNRVAL